MADRCYAHKARACTKAECNEPMQVVKTVYGVLVSDTANPADVARIAYERGYEAGVRNRDEPNNARGLYSCCEHCYLGDTRDGTWTDGTQQGTGHTVPCPVSGCRGGRYVG